MKATLLTAIALLTLIPVGSADVIRGIDIDFVTIRNPGNPVDTGNPYAVALNWGPVGYVYRIGKFEVTNAQWEAFLMAAGTPYGNPSTAFLENASFPLGENVPTSNASWYEAAQFCNYLTSGDKSKGAYLFSGNNFNPGDFLGTDRAAAVSTYGTVYVIPTENEWYKAAYYRPDGSGYSAYANGLDTLPPADNGWNYNGGSYASPWDVGTGTMEQNGTYDMMGNIMEWTETPDDNYRARDYFLRGGLFTHPYSAYLSSTFHHPYPADQQSYMTGLRVAAIPEPATLLLLGFGALALRRRGIALPPPL
jgi:hypothetical protein